MLQSLLYHFPCPGRPVNCLHQLHYPRDFRQPDPAFRAGFVPAGFGGNGGGLSYHRMPLYRNSLSARGAASRISAEIFHMHHRTAALVFLQPGSRILPRHLCPAGVQFCLQFLRSQRLINLFQHKCLGEVPWRICARAVSAWKVYWPRAVERRKIWDFFSHFSCKGVGGVL